MISLNSNTTLSTLNTATSVDMEHNKQKKKKVLFYQSKRERERERERERARESYKDFKMTLKNCIKKTRSKRNCHKY